MVAQVDAGEPRRRPRPRPRDRRRDAGCEQSRSAAAAGRDHDRDDEQVAERLDRDQDGQREQREQQPARRRAVPAPRLARRLRVEARRGVSERCPGRARPARRRRGSAEATRSPVETLERVAEQQLAEPQRHLGGERQQGAEPEQRGDRRPRPRRRR